MDRCERSVIATLVNTKMTFNNIGGATTGSIDGYVFTTNTIPLLEVKNESSLKIDLYDDSTKYLAIIIRKPHHINYYKQKQTKIVCEKSSFYRRFDNKKGHIGIRRAPLPFGWQRSSVSYNQITRHMMVDRIFRGSMLTSHSMRAHL